MIWTCIGAGCRARASGLCPFVSPLRSIKMSTWNHHVISSESFMSLYPGFTQCLCNLIMFKFIHLYIGSQIRLCLAPAKDTSTNWSTDALILGLYLVAYSISKHIWMHRDHILCTVVWTSSKASDMEPISVMKAEHRWEKVWDAMIPEVGWHVDQTDLAPLPRARKRRIPSHITEKISACCFLAPFSISLVHVKLSSTLSHSQMACRHVNAQHTVHWQLH